jgi:hypothetical protein
MNLFLSAAETVQQPETVIDLLEWVALFVLIGFLAWVKWGRR